VVMGTAIASNFFGPISFWKEAFMATATQTTAATLRMDATEARRRIEGGEPAIILDVRNRQAWDNSDTKIAGAQRIDAEHLRPDPSWSKNQLVLVYCT
jgi:hypothetical protein